MAHHSQPVAMTPPGVDTGPLHQIASGTPALRPPSQIAGVPSIVVRSWGWVGRNMEVLALALGGRHWFALVRGLIELISAAPVRGVACMHMQLLQNRLLHIQGGAQ